MSNVDIPPKVFVIIRDSIQELHPSSERRNGCHKVTTPEDYMGDVIGDINSRRGMVGELGERGNMKVVRATVPLANMFQYVSDLRSSTKGRASYSMNLESYELVPPNVEKELLSKYKGNTGEDDE